MVSLQLPALGFLETARATRPSPRQQCKESSVHAFSSTSPLTSCLCLSPCLSLSCPSHPFSSCLSLARCPSVPTSQEPCAAHGRRRISVPVSTPAHTHARFGRTHDLRREPLSGDHGGLAHVPSPSPHGPPAGGLHLRLIGTVQRLSPSKQAFHRSRDPRYTSFFHLARGLRMPLKSAAVRIPHFSSYSSLGHSQMPQGHDVVEPVRPGTELCRHMSRSARHELCCFPADCCHPSRRV